MWVLRLAIIVGIATSCVSDEVTEDDLKNQEDKGTFINYYFTIKPFGDFDQLSFSFDYLNAEQRGSTIRTVYLDPSPVSLVEAHTSRLSLGTSWIESLPISGFSFGSSRFVVTRGSDTIPLIAHDFIFIETDLALVNQDTLDITFELDLSSSVVLDSAGVDWIFPKFSVIPD